VTGTATVSSAKRAHAGSNPARNSVPLRHKRVHARLSTRYARFAGLARCSRSSAGRAPDFYSGATRVRVLPRAPNSLRSLCPRSSMEQSGGVRSLRLRVRLAPWTPTLTGGLAERQGTAVLTRRDLWVAQVRSLHPPPPISDYSSAGVAQRQSRWLPPRRCGFDSRCPLHAAFVYWLGFRPFKLEKRDRYPQAGPIRPPSSNGRMPHFECGDRGSNP
jgi:hypothetical protein